MAPEAGSPPGREGTKQTLPSVSEKKRDAGNKLQSRLVCLRSPVGGSDHTVKSKSAET